MAEKKVVARKKKPKQLAVVFQDGCTGCSGSPTCIEVCPVDCIDLYPGPDGSTVNMVTQVNLDLCIGCKLCVKDCPWETISMLDYDEAYEKVRETTLEYLRESLPVMSKE
jgi:Na+-translocating ferredoxin:NAD+ oxidoreductase RNF subunit RnfB